jgi:conjugal transfer pilus assembly protein TraD
MRHSYQDMFRPEHESKSSIAWGASALSMCALQPPLWPLFSMGALALSCYRAYQTVDLYRFRASLSSLLAENISSDEAIATSKKHFAKGGLWIGKGFKWTQQHAEIARQIMYRNPRDIKAPPAWLPESVMRAIRPKNSVPLKGDAIGVPWIHGIGVEDEHELRLPIDALHGHTLVVGTTRAGKTKLYIQLTTQIIHNKDVLIVLDPKGDKDLENRMRTECEKAGRKFLFFHPAHPSKSIRINPLGNWNNVDEPATRIGQLIDADGSFAAFAWKTLFRIMRAQVADGSMPNIKVAKEYVQQGIEPLLERLIAKRLVSIEGAKWDQNLQSFGTQPARGKVSPIKSERLEQMIGKYLTMNIRDEAIDSLIAMVNHSKEHYSKMIQVLEPILEMLGSNELGAMLSPDPLDLSDKRPIYTTSQIIEEGAVLYVGLNSLSNKIIGSAIGSILLADFASSVGAMYNYGKEKSVYLLVDEAAEVVNEQTIQILNKGGGAGIKAFIATQTIADFDAVFGSTARTKQALGNLNNVICLRVKDTDMARWIADSFGKTSAKNISQSFSTGSNSSSIFTEFNGSSGYQKSDIEIPLVSPDLLTRLPGLQYFAFLAGSTLYKGRLSIINN